MVKRNSLGQSGEKLVNYLSSFHVVKPISETWIFILGMMIGILLDVIIYFVDNYARKHHTKSVVKHWILYTFLLGFFQILINIITIRVAKYNGLNGDLFVTGIFITQTLVISRLYRKNIDNPKK
ncbi:hypothetical protein OAV62_01880 [bacterium]|nr:hypothetical protein [bacterium]